jgi:hypothetical protein
MFTRQLIVRAACALSLAFFITSSLADNGVIVSVYCKSKGIGAVGTNLRGSIVKRTLTGNSVSGPTTIFDWSQGGLAQYPVISLDGQRVAFWRWGVSQTVSGGNVTWVQRPGPLPNPNYYPDTNWLSVVNIDGTGLKNLVMVDIPSISASEECLSAIAWPSGDWIYYEKPTNSWEIWRVNYKNPLLNEMVVKFVRDPAHTDAWSWAPFFRRFSMSADARFAAGQLTNYTNTSFFNFPPPGGDVLNPGAYLQGTGGCNTAMSASGTHIAHYLSGNHSTTYFKTYNGIIGQDDGSQNIQGGSETIRWAANSDNWLCQVYSSGLADDGYDQWANELVRDVKGSQTVFNTNNSGGWCNDAGQVWISGAPNPESYMNRSGSWVAVPPVVPRDLTAPTTPGNLQAVAQNAHVARLTWSASTDADSRVFGYLVYRGGTQIGITSALAYSDSGLTENTAYAYTVSAINVGNTESAKASASITMTADQGAAIYSIDANNGPTSIIVLFDEPLDQATAQTAGNYIITGGGLSVTGAALSADSRKVTLTTGSMTSGTGYTLTVRNVLDKATPAHASTATAPFTYSGLAHGLVYETYNVSGYDALPPAFTGTPIKTGVVRNFDNSNLGSSRAIRFKGYLKITTAGSYDLKMCAYYNAAMTLDGNRIIYTEESYSGLTWMATQNLSAGLHTLNVDVSTVGDLWLFVWYAGPDGIQHRISDDMLYHSANGAPVVYSYPQERSMARNMIVLRQTASNLDMRIATPGRYDVTITAPNGAIVRSLHDMHQTSVRVPIAGLARGLYLVKVFAQGKTIVRPVSLR